METQTVELVPVQCRGGLAETHVCSLQTLLCVLVRGQHCHWASTVILIISYHFSVHTKVLWVLL